MNKADAAALLSLEENEVHDVLDSPAGVLIKTTDGQTYIVVPEDNPDADGKVGVMFLSAPSPKYGGTFPVFAQPGAEDDIRTIADAKDFQDLAEEEVAGEELDEPDEDEHPAQPDPGAETLVTESGAGDEPAPAPGPEHAEEIEEATTKGAGEKAQEAAKAQGARAKRAAKQVEKKG